MATPRVFFSKHGKHKNGVIHEEIPVVENGYDVQESDEDEVFIQDPNLEISASKPLMHPRNKGQRVKIKSRADKGRLCTVCRPLFYFVALVSVLCAVMATIVYLANKHRSPHGEGDGIQGASGQKNLGASGGETLVGCDQIQVEDVWVVGFPKLITESAFRLVDVNKDGLLDVILGYGTEADGAEIDDLVCDIAFQGKKPCGGGVLALEAATGRELWRLNYRHEIYSLNCQYDLNQDLTKDCLAGGRMAVFLAISGRDGHVLWELKDTEAVNPAMNFYTPQYISDVDGDGVADIILPHGGDPTQPAGSRYRMSGRILLVSGRSGKVLRWMAVPDKRETYYSPQILSSFSGSQTMLFGTGGETHNGSLWLMDLPSFLKGRNDRTVKLTSDTHKGFMTPAALVDVTGDQVEDIIVPSFNSTLLAFDGKTFLPMWTALFPGSESYSTPAVGYFNEDQVPDLLVKYFNGPGYPIYYYGVTTVLDGKTGRRLLEPPLVSSIATQSSPLTVAMEGFGNDVFLVWKSDCQGHEGSRNTFTVLKEENSAKVMRSNQCRLRFNSQGYAQLLAVSRQHPQGVVVYNSVDRKKVEHSKWINTTAEAYEYFMKHPELFHGLKSATDTDTQSGIEQPSHPSEGLYEKFQQPDPHRTGSKKGPSQEFSSRNRVSAKNGLPSQLKPQSDDDSPVYYPNLDNMGGYPPGSEPAILYNQAPGTDYGYGTSYRDSGYGSADQYGGSYLPNGEPEYGNQRNKYYRRGHPGRHQSAGRQGWPRSYEEPRTGIPLERREIRRFQRHVGAHDDQGVQRLISTGTLAPSLQPSPSNESSSIDLIFGTYWTLPKRVRVILASDQKCIDKKMTEEGKLRYDTHSAFYQMNHDEFEAAVTEECLRSSGHGQTEDDDDTYEDLPGLPEGLKHAGQMTIYRLRLKFSCSVQANTSRTKCATVLPFSQQKWASYMGSNGDSYWRPPVL